MLEAEIKNKHLTIHNKLSEDYYKNKLMSEAQFIDYHGENWDNLQAELITAGYRQPPELPRDYGKEIDEMRADIAKLKEHGPGPEP